MAKIDEAVQTDEFLAVHSVEEAVQAGFHHQKPHHLSHNRHHVLQDAVCSERSPDDEDLPDSRIDRNNQPQVLCTIEDHSVPTVGVSILRLG